MLITSPQDNITTIRDFNHVHHVCHISILKLNFGHKFLLWWESHPQPKCFHMADQNHPLLKSLLKWKHLQQYYKITSICCNFTRNISYYNCSIIIIKICCNINSICSNFTSGFGNLQEVILRWGCKQEAEPRYIAEFASLSLSLSLSLI